MAQGAEQQTTVLHLSQTAERIGDARPVAHRAQGRGDRSGCPAVQTAINRRMAAALDRAHQVQGVRLETGAYNVGEERPQNGPVALARQPIGDFDRQRPRMPLLKLAGALQSDGLSTSSTGLRDIARDGPRRRGGFDRRGARGTRPSRRFDCRPHASRRSALPRSARRQCRDQAAGRCRALPAMAMAAPVAEPGEAMIRVTIEAELLLGPAAPLRESARMVLPVPPLLVISDRHQARRPLEEVAEAVFAGGCRWFSLREKDLPPDRAARSARRVGGARPPLWSERDRA